MTKLPPKETRKAVVSSTASRAFPPLRGSPTVNINACMGLVTIVPILHVLNSRSDSYYVGMAIAILRLEQTVKNH